MHIRLLELLFREHTDNADENEAAEGDDAESSSADGVRVCFVNDHNCAICV